MLTIYYSNKLEALASQLTALLKAEPLAPFQTESILVESSAMSYWLTKQITCQLGIAANIEFPFPASFVWQLFRLFDSDLPKSSSFDREPLSLRLYDLFNSSNLPEVLDQYLKQLNGSEQRFAFANHLAGLYDQYQIYRPEVLLEWKKGNFEGAGELEWQAQVWQQLITSGNSQDPDRAEILQKTLTGFNGFDLKGLPYKRLQVFAVSALPESYLQLLDCLSKFIEINVFVFSPSSEYWLDSKSIKHQGDMLDSLVDQNELLLLLAKQNQSFMRQLMSVTKSEPQACYVKTSETTLLHHLQNQITCFTQSAVKAAQVKATDQSIHINICHHAIREVQVLHDHLLHVLQNNADIQIDDIAVLVPDVDKYAPYFHAVFSTADNEIKIPYSVAEKGSLEDKPVKRILLALLSLPKTNFRHSDVVALLQEPLIATRFSIEDIELVKSVLLELNVRFSLGDELWVSYGDKVTSFSFEQAVDRVLKSYAFNDSFSTDDIITGIQDGNAEQLGRALNFIDSLSLIEKQLVDKPIDQHCQYIQAVMSRFFDGAESDALYEIQQVIDCLEKLKQWQELANFFAPISFTEFFSLFENELQGHHLQQSFKEQAVNVASLLPMRSIPFKVVCVLGMNDGQYPVPKSKDQIDLLALQAKLGDRNRLDEQRYLFLQALLSARESLYISYIGNSVIDNSEKYPSLLLRELMDFMDENFSVDGEGKVSSYLTHSHALQSFDERYFSTESELFSYKKDYYRQFQAVSLNKIEDAFCFNALCSNESFSESANVLHLSHLQQVFSNPSKALLNALSVQLQTLEAEELDAEAFSGSGLSRYQIFDEMFQLFVQGESLSDAQSFVKKGLLPQAEFAQLLLDDYAQAMQKILDDYQRLNLSAGKYQHSLQITSGDKVFKHQLMRCNEQGSQCIAVIANSLRGKHFFNAWLQHLMASSVIKQPFKSFLLSPNATYCFNTIEPDIAKQVFDEVVTVADSFSNELSWFFVNSGFAYAELFKKTADVEKSLKAFMRVFDGSSFNQIPGEFDDAYHQLAYKGADINWQPMVEASDRLFAVMLDYLEEVNLDE